MVPVFHPQFSPSPRRKQNQKEDTTPASLDFVAWWLTNGFPFSHLQEGFNSKSKPPGSKPTTKPYKHLEGPLKSQNQQEDHRKTTVLAGSVGGLPKHKTDTPHISFPSLAVWFRNFGRGGLPKPHLVSRGTGVQLPNQSKPPAKWNMKPAESALGLPGSPTSLPCG